MIPVVWKHPVGFRENIYLQFPYNIISNLIIYDPDVIITAEMGFRTTQSIIYKMLFNRSSIVLWAAVSERTEEGRGYLRYLIRRWILSKSEVVIVNGQSGAKYIKKLGYKDEKIVISPYTTDLSLFRYSEYPFGDTHERRILFVGRLEQRKGVIPMLHFLSSWCENHEDYNLIFEIVGSGPIAGEIMNLVLPVNLDVNMIGNINYYELPTIYARNQILVFPTLADEWGMVVSEAFAVGRPVLGSIFSQAVEELVIDGQNGWKFNPENEIETVSKLNIALTSTIDYLSWMGSQARCAIEMHTPGYAADQMMIAINKAMNNSRICTS